MAGRKISNSTGSGSSKPSSGGRKKSGAGNGQPSAPAGDDMRMQTVYLRPIDDERQIEATYAIKASRKVKGRVGLSFLLRLGLELISEKLNSDREGLIMRAQRLSEGEDQ